MRVLTICNHKGGTGKTTTCIHLAAALGLSGQKVLVIDLDPQGFLTRMVGADESTPASTSAALFDPNIRFVDLNFLPLNGFDLMPSSTSLTRKMRGLNKPTDVLWVKEVLQEASGYDTIFFDTAAAVTVYSLNALVASQHVVVPVTPEYQPVVGAEQTFQTVGMVRERLNPELHAPLFLFTQVDARKRTHHKYRQYIRKHYRRHVMKSIIRTSAALAASYDGGETVFQHDPRSRGARDYANATDELWSIVKRREERAAESRGDAPGVSRSPHPEQAMNGTPALSTSGPR